MVMDQHFSIFFLIYLRRGVIGIDLILAEASEQLWRQAQRSSNISNTPHFSLLLLGVGGMVNIA